MTIDLRDSSTALPPRFDPADLVQRLVAEFGDRLGIDVIEQSVDAAKLRLAGARIDTFVPILMERDARQQIRVALRAAQPSLPSRV